MLSERDSIDQKQLPWALRPRSTIFVNFLHSNFRVTSEVVGLMGVSCRTVARNAAHLSESTLHAYSSLDQIAPGWIGMGMDGGCQHYGLRGACRA